MSGNVLPNLNPLDYWVLLQLYCHLICIYYKIAVCRLIQLCSYFNFQLGLHTSIVRYKCSWYLVYHESAVVLVSCSVVDCRPYCNEAVVAYYRTVY